MPLYDFKCPSCGHLYEDIVRYGELSVCPKCNLWGTDRLMGRPSYRMTGYNAANGYAEKGPTKE